MYEFGIHLRHLKLRRRKSWCKYHIYQWRKDVLHIINNIWLLFLALLCTLQLQATLERKWWYTKKDHSGESDVLQKQESMVYQSYLFFVQKFIEYKILKYTYSSPKKNGKAVNKFDFLLLPIFYIGNVSFIVTATWLILLKAQFYYRLY